MELFEKLINAIQGDTNGFLLKILDKRLVCKKTGKDYQFTFSLSSQDSGDSTLLLYNGGELCYCPIEKLFSSLIIEELDDYRNPKNTLIADSLSCPPSNDLHFKKVKDQNDFILYKNSLLVMLNNGHEKLVELVKSNKLFATFVGQFPFDKRDMVIVGGRFPLNLMKKLLILRKGDLYEAYCEYKEGLERLLQLYEEKKPDQIDTAKMFWKGYEYFIEKLEERPIQPLA